LLANGRDVGSVNLYANFVGCHVQTVRRALHVVK
jgi:DNA-binding transcriptional regulator YhcF (GntR family)